MNVCVLGLWHLGTVTAACLASVGHQVTGLDFDADAVAQLQQGQPPLFEPGLQDLVKRGLTEGRLRFTTDMADAVRRAQVVWVAYDTPVDDEDRADVEFVVERVSRLFPCLGAGTLVLISSQLPVGTTRRLERLYAAACSDKPVSFGYSPENLRLGKAISVFTQPDRVVVGMRSQAHRERVAALLRPITDHIEWMSVESAEMTKHALNAFLATSVTFINELATLCEQVGADAREVERGLKTEARIGPKAYLGPGAAFAGGTLARDVAFLSQLGAERQLPMHLMSAVRASNDAHKLWPRRKLHEAVGDLQGQTIAVWGLTYKPGTDTLRCSSSVELCQWLAEQGARVRAHDPVVKSLPPGWAGKIELCATPLIALDGAVALVVATEWPEYQAVPLEAVVSSRSGQFVVIDANRFLAKIFADDPRIRYIAVGSPTRPGSMPEEGEKRTGGKV
jgi:UDPglucose 6-dehydrogenase